MLGLLIFRTVIQYLFIILYSKIKPEARTLTVSSGDQVTLSVLTDIPTSLLRWRYNSAKTNYRNAASVDLSNVEREQAGIYECIENDKRKEKVHAFIALHVQSRWQLIMGFCYCEHKIYFMHKLKTK